MVDTDKHAVWSRRENSRQSEGSAGFALFNERPGKGTPRIASALAAIAASLLFSTSAKAQGADPINFDDPRLMRQVIKDPVSGVISTNYYVPKELGVDGKPVLHSVSTMALELDANGRPGVAQVDECEISVVS